MYICKVKLDDTLMTNDDFGALTLVLDNLYNKACCAVKVDPLLLDVETYVAASFSFEDGNAHRSDISSNATLAEYLAWRFTHQGASNDCDFRVHNHKTAHMYSAGRVSVTARCKPLLLAYGDARALENPDVQMHPYALSTTDAKRKWNYGKIDYNAVRLFKVVGSKRFTNIWRQVRLCNPNITQITNTQFRHFIETRVRAI